MTKIDDEWFIIDSKLIHPFNKWPKWAVELDIELSDKIGDHENDMDDETENNELQLVASGLDEARVILSNFMTRMGYV